MKDGIANWIKLNRLLVFAMLVVGAAILLLFVDNQVKINTLLTEIQQKRSAINDLKASNELLRSKVIELEAVDRISRIAKNNLGLEMPTNVPIVIEVDNTEDE